MKKRETGKEYTERIKRTDRRQLKKEQTHNLTTSHRTKLTIKKQRQDKDWNQVNVTKDIRSLEQLLYHQSFVTECLKFHCFVFVFFCFFAEAKFVDTSNKFVRC